MSKYKLAWFDKESRPVNVFFNVDSNKDAREFLEKFSEGMPYPISLYVDEDSLPEKLEIEALPELFEIKIEAKEVEEEVTREDLRINLEYVADCIDNIYERIGNAKVNETGEGESVHLDTVLEILEEITPEYQPVGL